MSDCGESQQTTEDENFRGLNEDQLGENKVFSAPRTLKVGNRKPTY